MNLSFEIGAFFAGVSLATSPIAKYIAENLRPLRDFFLIMFFFTVGADLNTGLITTLWLPVLVISVVIVVSKPLVFSALLRAQGEPDSTSREVGFRLGQGSEVRTAAQLYRSEQCINKRGCCSSAANSHRHFYGNQQLSCGVALS